MRSVLIMSYSFFWKWKTNKKKTAQLLKQPNKTVWGKKNQKNKQQIECRWNDHSTAIILPPSSPEPWGCQIRDSLVTQLWRCWRSGVQRSEEAGENRQRSTLQNKHSSQKAANCSSMSRERTKMTSFKGTSGLNQMTSATNHTKLQRKSSGFQMSPQKL